LPLPVRPAVSAVRGAFVRQFLLAVRDDPGPRIARVARQRMTDPNVRPSEAAWLARKAADAERANEPS